MSILEMIKSRESTHCADIEVVDVGDEVEVGSEVVVPVSVSFDVVVVVGSSDVVVVVVGGLVLVVVSSVLVVVVVGEVVVVVVSVSV